jgi:hypothetical protein
MATATAPRTDIHRPSAPEFNPEDYECHGVFDLDPEFADARRRRTVIDALVLGGASFTGAPHGNGQCSHCGHRPLRYVALMLHRPTRTLMYVGETCLDARFDLTKGEFARLRREAAVAARRRREGASSKTRALIDAHPELVELLNDHSEIVYGWGEFLPKMARCLRDGRMTEKMINASVEAIRKGRARIAARDQAERDRVERELAAPVEIPVGRTEVSGTIRKTVVRDSDYGARLVMIVDIEGGDWTADLVVPSALLPIVATEEIEQLAGRRVQFTAEFRQGNRRDYAFGVRPTRARFLS